MASKRAADTDAVEPKRQAIAEIDESILFVLLTEDHDETQTYAAFKSYAQKLNLMTEWHAVVAGDDTIESDDTEGWKNACRLMCAHPRVDGPWALAKVTAEAVAPGGHESYSIPEDASGLVGHATRVVAEIRLWGFC